MNFKMFGRRSRSRRRSSVLPVFVAPIHNRWPPIAFTISYLRTPGQFGLLESHFNKHYSNDCPQAK